MRLRVDHRDFIYRALQTFLKHSLTLFIYYFSAFVLSPETYGQAVYLISIAAFILLFCDFGLSASITTFVAGGREWNGIDSKKGLSKIVILLSAFAALVLAVVFAFYWFTDQLDSNILYLFPYIFLTPLNSVLDGYLMGIRNFKKLFQINSIYSALAFVSSLLLIRELGLTGVLLSFSVNAGILFLTLVFFNSRLLTFSIVEVKVRGVLSYSLLLGVSSLSYFLYTRFDVFILEHYGYLEEIGHYEIINRLFMVLVIPFVILGQVQAPKIAEKTAHYAYQEIRSHFLKLMLGVFILGVIVALGLLLLVPVVVREFLPAYHTEDFMEINRVLVAILPLKFAGVLLTIGFVTPTGFAKMTSIATMIFGVLNVLLDIAFILEFGFIGVFYATFIAHNLSILIQWLIYYRHLTNKGIQWSRG